MMVLSFGMVDILYHHIFSLFIAIRLSPFVLQQFHLRIRSMWGRPTHHMEQAWQIIPLTILGLPCEDEMVLFVLQFSLKSFSAGLPYNSVVVSALMVLYVRAP